MYVPTSYAVSDPGKLEAVMRDHSFATVITTDAAGSPFASHVPVLFYPEDIAGVAVVLSRSPDQTEREVAALMAGQISS